MHLVIRTPNNRMWDLYLRSTNVHGDGQTDSFSAPSLQFTRKSGQGQQKMNGRKSTITTLFRILSHRHNTIANHNTLWDICM